MFARWCFAVIAFFSASSLLWADYLFIKINLNDKNLNFKFDPNKGKGSVPDPKKDLKPDLPPVWYHAFLELKPGAKAKPIPFPVPHVKNVVYEIEMKGNRPSYYVRGTEQSLPIKASTAAKLFTDKQKNESDNTVANALRLAEFALERGLFKEFEQAIDDVRKLDPKNAIAQAVAKVKEDLKKPPTIDDPAVAGHVKSFAAHGYRFIVSPGGHYTMWTNLEAAGSNLKDLEVLRRLGKFEKLFHTFFYYHALKGKPLTMPPHRLAIVMVKTPLEDAKPFVNQQVLFDNLVTLGDGFTSRRDNLVILASRRLDDVYVRLVRYNQDHLKVPPARLLELNAQLLIGQLPQQDSVNVPAWQALALLQVHLEESGETATVTHEGARQLIAATGILPRSVITAEWLQFGLASFFETPHAALYPSTGAPNWSQLIDFKVLRKLGQLEAEKAREVLLNVVSDRYFQEAFSTVRQSASFKEGGDGLKDKAQAELVVARSTAWALTYFLAQKKPKEFERYLVELRALPRDLEYDEQVLLNCFGRAFNLLTTDAKTQRRRLDLNQVELLANEWFGHLETTSLDNIDVEREMIRAQLEAARPAKK